MSKPRTVKPTKVPSLATPPTDVSPQLRAYLANLSEALDIRLGRRGDKRDRAITLRELIDSGLAVDLASAPFDPNNPGSDIGNPNDDGTPSGDVEIPTQPTGFSATGGYAIAQLYWDLPTYRGRSITEIWRYDSDTIGDAILVGVSSGISFVDPIGESQTVYYWIRHVNVNGDPGVFNATAGTAVTTASNVSNLLSELTGSISASQLTTSLANQIDGSGSAVDLANLETFVGYDSTYTGDDLETRLSDSETQASAVETFVGYTASYVGNSLLSRVSKQRQM